MQVYTLATDDGQHIAVSQVRQMIRKRLFDVEAFDQMIYRSTKQLTEIAEVFALMTLDECLSCSADGFLIIHIN